MSILGMACWSTSHIPPLGIGWFYLGVIAFIFISGSLLTVFWDGSRLFLKHYQHLCLALPLSLPQVALLYEAEFIAHCRNRLKRYGQRVKDIDDAYPPYSAERAEAKKDFENYYKSCLALGIIDDVGWGAFIPKDPFPAGLI